MSVANYFKWTGQTRVFKVDTWGQADMDRVNMSINSTAVKVSPPQFLHMLTYAWQRNKQYMFKSHEQVVAAAVAW